MPAFESGRRTGDGPRWRAIRLLAVGDILTIGYMAIIAHEVDEVAHYVLHTRAAVD